MSLIITVGLALFLFPVTLLAFGGLVAMFFGGHFLMLALLVFLAAPMLFSAGGPILVYLVLAPVFGAYQLWAIKNLES